MRPPRQTEFSKTLPFAITEHGTIQAANVLTSPQAVKIGVYVERVFVRLREMIVADMELAQHLDELERAAETLAMRHDSFAHNTRMQLHQVSRQSAN